MSRSKHSVLSSVLLMLHLSCRVDCEERIWSSRNPRYLPFPVGSGNKLQIITGFGIPVDLKEDSVTFGLILKTNYELPTNAVQFTRPEIAFPDVELKMTRWSLYSALESALEKLSLGGRNCILRSICQTVFTSFEGNGLFGEILEILFLPSRTNEHSFINNDYTAAERISQHLTKEQQCASKFPSCPATLLDLISIVQTSEYTEDIIEKLTELL